MTWLVLPGDVREVLSKFDSNKLDACLCDPPYGFSFMGKSWDYDVPSVETWADVLRVLKPGAALIAFGGSRTYHRLACGIEDAGFELRDQLMWLYGKGFPKSLNIGLAIDKVAGAERQVVGTRTLTGNAAISTKEKGGTYGVQVGSVPAKEVNVTAPATALAQAWDGYGTALKPAFEPVVLARKPLEGTVAANVARWGVGGLAIDACRIGHSGANDLAESRSRNPGRDDRTVSAVYEGGPRPQQRIDDSGRWPANLILDEDAAAILDAEVGPRISGKAVRRNGGGGQIFSGVGNNPYKPKPSLPDLGYLDGQTNPSRFFFTSKVSTGEREFGCEHLPKRSAAKVTDSNEDDERLNSPRTGAGRTGGARNYHPTLKPISLCRWLATLILPPPRADGEPRRILVPFSGAGSEMIGAMRAGWEDIVGIQRDTNEEERGYIEIAESRLRRWAQVPTSLSEADAVADGTAAANDNESAEASGQAVMFR